MNKILLPPTVLLILIVMVLLHWLWPITTLISLPLNVLGIAPVLLGVTLSSAGAKRFAAVGTTLDTFSEPNKLVTDGPYKYSRNPIYLGYALVLIGVWLLLGSLSPLFIVVFSIVITDRWYIPFEENMLAEKFGPAYTSYKSRTRRWI
jgi:protein-S-isoprenylcysteine O-methyltransferase Ste14